MEIPARDFSASFSVTDIEREYKASAVACVFITQMKRYGFVGKRKHLSKCALDTRKRIHTATHNIE